MDGIQRPLMVTISTRSEWPFLMPKMQQPSFVAFKTQIGFGSPNKGGTACHGAPLGAEEVELVRST